jgi:tetratricopeptide (TPR) repeat protein
MPGLLAVLLVGTALSGDLSTAAKLSSRPRWCAPAVARAGESSAPDAWDQVREQGRQQLCRRLARAELALGNNPELALKLGAELAHDLPDRAEPLVLEAQAQTRLRAFGDAWPLWEAALQHGAEPLSAHALRDYAVSAALTGHSEAALAAYRRLLPLLQAWSDPIDQQAIYLEAAVAAMQRGPDGLEEATGQLAAARARASSTGLRALSVGLSALAAARRAQPSDSESRLDAPEVWHFVETVQSGRLPGRWPALPPHELFGAAALLVEPYSDTAAAELWTRHAAGLEQAGAPAPWRGLAAEQLKHIGSSPRSSR